MTSTVANSINSGLGASGTVLQSNGNTSAPGYVAASSVGGMALLATGTANNTATNVAFTSVLSSTYIHYTIVAYNVVLATSTANLYLQYSQNNGMSWDDATSGNYITIHAFAQRNSSPSFTLTGSTTNTQIPLLTSANNSTNLSFTVELVNPNIYLVDCYWFVNYENSSSQNIYGFGSGNYTPSDAVNAIRFAASSGNITSGVFKVYGWHG